MCASLDDTQRWAEPTDWDDGLGIRVPTRDELDDFVRVAGYRGDEVLPLVTPRRATTTVRDAAAQLMFTRGEARALPVVVAALSAMGRSTFNLPGILATTGNAAVCVIYSGRDGDSHGLCAGGNTLGPRAGQNPAVGRAVALFLQNVCGSTSSVLDMSTIGQPGKFACCGAETSLADVEGWEPPEPPVVTVHAFSGMLELVHDQDHDADLLLAHVIDTLVSATHRGDERPEPALSPAVLLAPEHARVFAAAGYGRRELAARLREGCRAGGGDGECRTRVYVMGGVGRKSACVLPWSGGSLASTSPVGRPEGGAR